MHPLLNELYEYHNKALMLIDEIKALNEQLAKDSAPLKDNGHIFKLLSRLHDDKERQHHQNEDLIKKRLAMTGMALHPRILDLEQQHSHFYNISEHLKLLVDSDLSRQEMLAIVDDYIRKYYEHIDLENNTFFPLADRCLTEEDWQHIQAKWQHH